MLLAKHISYGLVFLFSLLLQILAVNNFTFQKRQEQKIIFEVGGLFYCS